MNKKKNDVSFEKLFLLSQQCLSFKTKKLSRLVVQKYDDALRKTGIRSTQLTILIAIRLQEPVNMNQLAESVSMDRSTAIRGCNALEKEGYVSLSPGEDRRYKFAELTAQGKKKITEAYPLWQDVQNSVSGIIGKTLFDTISKAIVDVTNKLA
ncbi:MAG: winged helix-turn-helix transcriptional regulator [bacterium]|nr:winged helix-turn-helix transcriptional regulator [bacterium]